ncbi:3-hydroxyacyl-CoA dehydrogenase NAD-binding domain-containing protein [Sapientia aquatica]|uniref:3-hydroxyacyl-CoA dehydrogenase n=1 Tax=Sapientia aquatica TaxID=1549640 RepID=A0A4R5W119_9BURK|nr:3-hydroxyacyl-CoA dehydrogenase NAD-binding domain-containing protein [Sapientia aquatica]TDK65642.1 3-hydroxyacyl-CoA dehydrogenase [Sapientia aquatica]
MTETIILEVDADGVALITIDVLGREFNAFVPELLEQLRVVVHRISTDSIIKGAVITSGKVGSFIVGADLTDIVQWHDKGMTAQAAAQRAASGAQVFRQLELCGKPVAAAINGLALGGGYEFCLACHYRVLVDDDAVRIGLPDVQLGLLPSAGGTQRLPRLIGIERALPLLLSGQHLSAREALAYQLVDTLAPADKLVETARQWVLTHPDAHQPWDSTGFRIPGGAGAMANHSVTSFGTGLASVRQASQDNYPAPLAILSCVYEGTQLPFDLALKIEAKYFGSLACGVVARNLMRTMFINKGAADKLVRRPQDVEKRQVTRLGVLGAGLMGAGIAHVAALAGINVVLLDSTIEQANKGWSYSKKILDKSVLAGRISAQQAEVILARILATTDFSQLAESQLIVEAVFEDRAIKSSVMEKVAGILSSEGVFASNTSTLPITGLAQQWSQPQQFIGLHFFSPVERMPLVEVIIGQQTSQATIAAALDFVAQLKKTPIIVHDSPSFYTSRIFCSYIDEGMAMLAEGIQPALIENAARSAGFAVGPLAVTDEVSIDLQKRILDQSQADQLPEKFQRRHAHEVINRFYQLGRLGRKTGGGFYDFPVDGKKRLWSGLSELYPLKQLQPELSEVQHRLLYLQALEAARCMEEGVINDAADADLGAVLGLGYPAWTGGTLSLIDSVGIRLFVARCEHFANQYGERYRPSAWLRARAEHGEQFYSKASVHP